MPFSMFDDFMKFQEWNKKEVDKKKNMSKLSVLFITTILMIAVPFTIGASVFSYKAALALASMF